MRYLDRNTLTEPFKIKLKNELDWLVGAIHTNHVLSCQTTFSKTIRALDCSYHPNRPPE